MKAHVVAGDLVQEDERCQRAKARGCILFKEEEKKKTKNEVKVRCALPALAPKKYTDDM